MKYEEAKEKCPVGRVIYRTGDKWRTFTQADYDALRNPSPRDENRIGKLEDKMYWKGVGGPLDDKISAEDKLETDWEVG